MSAVRDRQNTIRDWWRMHRYNPPFLALSAARWGTMDIVERWMDMQARVACKDEGTLLADNIRWAIIELQLAYPPLWLVSNWHQSAVRKVHKAMLTQYHVLLMNQGRLVLTPASRTSSLFPGGIGASDADIYGWLGLTGGERHAVTPRPPHPRNQGGQDG